MRCLQGREIDYDALLCLTGDDVLRAEPASARVGPAFEPSLALPSVPRPAEGATAAIAAIVIGGDHC